MRKIFKVCHFPCFFTVTCFLFSSFFAVYALNVPAPGQLELEKRVEKILKHQHLKKATISVRIVTAKDNRVLFSHNTYTPLKPASNMKLLTTAAALLYLGGGFEFETGIYISHKVSKGKLPGNIIIKAGGDPNISGRFYNDNITAVPEMWADKVAEAGIKSVEGDIVVDDTMFDREYINTAWPQDQLSNWYCAQISALSFNDNCIDVTVKPQANIGKPAIVATNPETGYVKIVNSCKVTGKKSKHAISIFRKIGTNIVHVKGKCWKNAKSGSSWVTIDNPSLYLATVFKELLEKRGIEVTGAARFAADDDIKRLKKAKKITSTTSTIEQTINVTNKRSQNFYAEQLLKTLGYKTKGKGSFKSGLAAISDMLADLGYEPGKYIISDGSGLSKKNRLTTRIFTDLLCFMSKSRNNKMFIDSLPKSGEQQGSLRKRMKQAPYKSRIKAKTGYILGASGLSGYAEPPNGELIAFSILVNDFKISNRHIKNLQDSICKAIIDCCGSSN